MRAEKISMVREIQDQLEGTKYVILADCRGLKVEQMTALRNELRKTDARVKVVKNTYFHVATKELGLPDMSDALVGPTTMIAGPTDITQVAKAILAYIKGNNNLPVLKAGALGKSRLTAKDVEALAKMPPREVMLSVFVGTLAAPMTKFVGTLNAKVCSLLYVLKAVEEKKRNAGQ